MCLLRGGVHFYLFLCVRVCVVLFFREEGGCLLSVVVGALNLSSLVDVGKKRTDSSSSK